MTKKDLTTMGLTDEQADEVLILFTNDTKELVPKKKLDTLTEEKAALEVTLTETKAEIDTLKSAGNGNSDLQEQLNKALADNTKIKKDSAIDIFIAKSNTHDNVSLKANLNYDTIAVDEAGEITGLDEQITGLKQNEPWLFDESLSGREPYAGGKGAVALGNGKHESILEVETSRNSNSTAGEDFFTNRKIFMLHPRGIRWEDAERAKTFPSNYELSRGSNWGCVYEDKSVRIVKFKFKIK